MRSSRCGKYRHPEGEASGGATIELCNSSGSSNQMSTRRHAGLFGSVKLKKNTQNPINHTQASQPKR